MKENIIQGLEEQLQPGSEFFEKVSWHRKVGFGRNPALLIIDLAHAWTKPTEVYGCLDMDDVIIPSTQKLLASARNKRLPIIFTTTAYDVVEGPASDMGYWVHKTPLENLKAGSPAVQIDDRVMPADGEHVIVKKRASAFFGTHLSALLQSAGVDTLIITGVAASGCVRHTAMDTIAYGFRPIVVREAVGDRFRELVWWNLYDIQKSTGDVESLEAVTDYIDGLNT